MSIPLAHSLKRTVDATLEPITTAQAKTHLGIPASETGHDTYVGELIKAARMTVENDTRRAMNTQTWVLKLDAFPTKVESIELYKPPLLGITSITYVPTSGGSTTWSSTAYEVDTNRTPGVVFTKFSEDYPSSVRDIQNAVTITYTAGYGATRSDVPETAKLAMRMLVDDWFNGRCTEGPANRDAYLSLIHALRWGDYR